MTKSPTKFRGKTTTGAWVTGSRVDHPAGKTFIIRYSGHGGAPEWHDVDPNTVGEYTGRQDMHGKPIFEGDTVTTAKYTGTVAWMPGKACYQIKPYGIYLTGQLEVLGNIHDNPELLKGGDQ